jgi:hypothetical protein
VGPRVGLDGCGKFRPPPGFDPRTLQPVASRYTDYATPAHTNYVKTFIITALLFLPVVFWTHNFNLHSFLDFLGKLPLQVPVTLSWAYIFSATCS